MKILYVTDNFDENLSYRENYYARELSKKNEVYILTSTNRLYIFDKPKFKEGMYSWKNIKIIRKKPILKLRDTMFSIRGYKKVIENLNPDIIHTFEGIKISTARIGMWAKKKGYIVVYDQENRIEGGRNFLSKMKYFFGKFYEKKIVNCADIIRVVTLGGRNYLLKKYAKISKKIMDSSLGYDPKKFYSSKNMKKTFRKEYNLEKKIVFGVTGKFFPEKKIELIINSFLKLKNKGIILFIKGKFEKNYLDLLKERFGNKKNVFIEDSFMNSNNLNKFYNGVDLMIWTKQTVSFFEALGSKTQILIPYFNATSHIGDKVKKGIIYYGSQKLFDKNENILNDKLMKESLFNGMQKYINQDMSKIKINALAFSWGNICKNLEKEYINLIKNKNLTK